MKILIVKPSSLGDIIQSNPVPAALKKLYPDSQISWLIFDAWSDIIDLFPDVDKKIIWKKSGGLNEYLRIITKIREEKYNLVIDLQGLLRTALICSLSGADKIIGVPGLKEGSGIFVKEVFPESKSLNAVFRSLETVRFLGNKKFEPAFNLKVDNILEISAEKQLKEKGILAKDKLIGIVPSVRGKAKQWPLEYFRELIRYLNKRYPEYKLIIFGDKNCENAFKGEDVIDLCGKTDLKILAALLKKCEIVVGPDTGAVHLASALGIPVIAIFGGSDVKETAPISKNAIIIKKDFNCSPCRGKPVCKNYDCLYEIKPEEVLTAIKQWIK